jgi:hypothetical protein
MERKRKSAIEKIAFNPKGEVVEVVKIPWLP